VPQKMPQISLVGGEQAQKKKEQDKFG